MTAFPTMEWVLEWVRLANDSEEFQVGGLGRAGVACPVVRQKPGSPNHGTYIRLTGRDGHWSRQILGVDPDLAIGARIVLDGVSRGVEESYSSGAFEGRPGRSKMAGRNSSRGVPPNRN